MHTATKKSSKIDISSENKLEEFAKNLAQNIKKGEIFFLYGEMGVGKTTFVKYFINNLQLKFDRKITEVTSPTFNIMNEYLLGNFVIKHYDLYRLKSESELKDLNLFENKNDDILLIEWPQIIKKEPFSVKKLYFEYKNDFKDRFLTISI
ncbi:tRNA (adenosine(37)-N6)-threonylcarbamoyltransferase complex ATPase subunit type 1 TsaE [Candidatus Pelagibacter sp.]|nr:tRNA (adenosine(37)-N6)-threonylcarbamoyltransferase complex ATPase subunit type 1 TsaE [Candidatus Pelagibacter sp.]